MMLHILIAKIWLDSYEKTESGAKVNKEIAQSLHKQLFKNSEEENSYSRFTDNT